VVAHDWHTYIVEVHPLIELDLGGDPDRAVGGDAHYRQVA
jgi:hypothetical protein